MTENNAIPYLKGYFAAMLTLSICLLFTPTLELLGAFFAVFAGFVAISVLCKARGFI